uniref:Putative ovule protein n=1 Tax=Solanum chacoense TaxID=4108 RepID=A0A0V0GTI8_SOLCH
MGDRITALQQLVSPFGKTDTASVLSEAIEYIKFLHDQVNVLSTPYMKSGASIQHQQSTGDKSNVNPEGGNKILEVEDYAWSQCLVPFSNS